MIGSPARLCGLFFNPRGCKNFWGLAIFVCQVVDRFRSMDRSSTVAVIPSSSTTIKNEPDVGRSPEILRTIVLTLVASLAWPWGFAFSSVGRDQARSQDGRAAAETGSPSSLQFDKATSTSSEPVEGILQADQAEEGDDSGPAQHVSTHVSLSAWGPTAGRPVRYAPVTRGGYVRPAQRAYRMRC